MTVKEVLKNYECALFWIQSGFSKDNLYFIINTEKSFCYTLTEDFK